MLWNSIINYYDNRRLIRVFSCAFLILFFCIHEQKSAAAIPHADDETVDANGSNDVLVDVPSVLIRNWYTSPDKKPFFSNRYSILQGWSVSAFWSPQYTLSPSKYSSFNAFGVGAALQKDFNKSIAVRLSGQYLQGEIPVSSAKVDRYMGSLDLLWNFANTWFGYNPARSLESLLVVGGTFGKVKSENQPSDNVWQGQLGVQFRKTLSPHISAFVEPYYYVSDPDYDYFQNGADYDDGLGVKAGILVRLTEPLRETPWFAAWANPQLFENWYIQNLIGMNFAKEKGLTDSHDLSEYSYNLNIGHWVHPTWGFQVGLTDRQLLFEGNNNRRQTLGRLEGILNIPSLWNKISIKRFGLVVSGGAELGYERKYSSAKGRTWNIEDGFYSGITGAAQLKYFINSNTALVAEGRYSSAGDGKSVITPSVGLEFYRSHYKQYSFWRKSAEQRHNDKQKQGLGGILFLNNKNLFLEVAASVDRESNVSRYKSLSISPAAVVAIGMRLNDLHAVRLKDHLIYHSKDDAGYTQFHNELSLDYLFDLTNFWMGMSQYRRFSLRPFAGITYSASNLATSPFIHVDAVKSFAFDFGFQNSFRLNSNTELFIEPRYLFMLDDCNRWNLSAGITYAIERRSQVTHLLKKGVPDNPAHFYVQALGGLQIATDKNFTRSTQFSGLFDLTFGRSFARNLAIQASLFHQTASPNSKDQIHRIYGVRGEFVADALGMLWTRSHEQGWAWTLQGGAEVAYNTFVNSPYYGPTAATQLRHRIGKTPFWITAQGRFQLHFAKVGKITGKKPIWSAAAGIHYELPSIKRWNRGANGTYGTINMYRTPNKNQSEFMRYLENWNFQIAGTWFNADKFGFGIAAIYDFDDINSMRVGYDFAQSSQTAQSGEKVNYNAFSVDYMLDLTNLLLNTKAAEPKDSNSELPKTLASRLSVRPFFGVNLGMHSFERNKTTYDKETNSSKYIKMTDLNLGLQAALNVNYRINKNVGIFLEQRVLYLNNDPYLAPDDEHDFHMLSSAGLKVSF